MITDIYKYYSKKIYYILFVGKQKNYQRFNMVVLSSITLYMDPFTIYFPLVSFNVNFCYFSFTSM